MPKQPMPTTPAFKQADFACGKFTPANPKLFPAVQAQPIIKNKTSGSKQRKR